MLRIHKAQKEAFEARSRETFSHRVRALLCEQLPEERARLDGRDGLATVEAAVEKASTLGFRGERDACKFVALDFLLGDGFEADAWAARVLADDALTPTDRIETLWSTAKQRALDEVAAGVAQALKG